MRTVGGIIAGLVVGYLALILIGIVGVGATYSVPGNVNVYSSRQVVELVLAMPPAAKVALLIALFGGTLIGAALAKLISRRAWVAWTVAILYAVLAGLGVLPLPMAGWMQAIAIVAPLIGGLIANHLVKSRVPDVPEEAAATSEG
jgi:hypothetical protein